MVVRSLSPSSSPINHSNHNKLSGQLRPQVQKIASPKTNNSLFQNSAINSLSPKGFRNNSCTKSTTSPSSSGLILNGTSPKLNSFKNLLNSYNRDGRTLQKSPEKLSISPKNNNSRCIPAPTFRNPDSQSSRQGSPNDSRDSAVTIATFNQYFDEDSNSSQHSSLSTDCGLRSEDSSTLTLPRRSRKKRNHGSDINNTDTLRENFNYVNNGGRKPQSTQNLIQKFNLKLDRNSINSSKNHQTYFSLSASSSPSSFSLTKENENSHKSAKNHSNHDKISNHRSTRNGFCSEENSLDSFESALQPDDIPYIRSQDHIDSKSQSNSDKFYLNDESFKGDLIVDSKKSSKSKSSKKSSNLSKSSSSSTNTISKIDQEIMNIYSKLPQINPDDFELMKRLQFNDESNDDASSESEDSKLVENFDHGNLDDSIIEDVNEFEKFDYDEEYEEEEDVVEIIEEELDVLGETEIEMDDSDGRSKESRINDDDDILVDQHTSFIPDSIKQDVEYDENKIELNNNQCDNKKCDTRKEEEKIRSENDSEMISISESSNNCDLKNNFQLDHIGDDHEDLLSTTNRLNHINDSVVNNDLITDNENDLENLDIEGSQFSENHFESISETNSHQVKMRFNDEEKFRISLVQSNQNDKKSETNIVDSVQIDGQNESKESNGEDLNTVKKGEEISNPSKNAVKVHKTITVRRLIKKKRKCSSFYKIKKSIVDRLANDHWQSYNGSYDKDNVWRDFSEMTSSYVLTGGENAGNRSDENVLHILPYVNCTW